MLMEVRVNVSNPTKYSAAVPYTNINVLNNGTILAQAIARNIEFVPGANDNILVQVDWNPTRFGQEKGAENARQLISRYLSNYNTTFTFQTHNGTFPTNPEIGSALSSFDLEVPVPKLHLPSTPDDGNDGEDKPHFVQDTTVRNALSV